MALEGSLPPFASRSLRLTQPDDESRDRSELLTAPHGQLAALELIARVARRTETRINERRVESVADRLRTIARNSEHSLVGDFPAFVSLTTHGDRVRDVPITIESIGAGRVKPQRLVLLVDNDATHHTASSLLAEQVRRGLEIVRVRNVGPHTKYFSMLPSVLEDRNAVLVTADDDIVYPTSWLDDLATCFVKDPDLVHCHRAHRIVMEQDGIAPYSRWAPVVRSRIRASSPRTFATGVSGVLYPRRMVSALAERGDAFLDVAPRADDIWLHSVAVEEAVPVQQVGLVPRHFPLTPGSQASRLMDSNVGDLGNDSQVRATYSELVLRRLANDAY